MRTFLACLGILGLATVSSASDFYNAATVADNTATRNLFLSDLGIVSGDYFVDFENFAVGTNMDGQALSGGLVLDNTGTGAMDIRGTGAFGGSNPIGARAVFHNESASLVLNFSPGVSYLGAFGIDHGGSTHVKVTLSDLSTETFELDATISTGDSAEFFGIVATSGLSITRVEIDADGVGGWGLDNLEYGAVPEPATCIALGLGACAFARRRRS